VKRNDAAWTDVPCDPPKHRRGIRLKLENVPPDYSVEWAVEPHLGRITFQEVHVCHRVAGRASPRRVQCCGNPVHRHNLAKVADYSCDEKRYVAGACTDVKHAHALADTSLQKEMARNGIDEARLRLEAPDFQRRMT
jgi:hypothetical protein